jgi:predicted GNAT family acetyltransferase
MRAVRHDTVQDFLDAAMPLLERDEVENNLLAGIAGGLVGSAVLPERTWFATVEGENGAATAAALCTPPFPVLTTRLDDAQAELLVADLARELPELAGVLGPKSAASTFAEAWSARTGEEVRHRVTLRNYALEAVKPISPCPGRFRPFAETEADLLERWAGELGEVLKPDAPGSLLGPARHALTGGNAHLWEDGVPVSMAVCAGRTPHGARIALVYTPPDLRGRGYATACVAALSQALLDGGARYCFLNADDSNPVPNRVYERVGFSYAGNYLDLRFVRGE